MLSMMTGNCQLPQSQERMAPTADLVVHSPVVAWVERGYCVGSATSVMVSRSCCSAEGQGLLHLRPYRPFAAGR